MKHPIGVNLGNLILSLSDAMDLSDPLLMLHQQRTGFIVWQMGKIAGFDDQRLEKIFMAALLHDIGAFSLGERIALIKFEVDNVVDHCIRGEALFKSVPWLKELARMIRFHHRKWSDWNESIDIPDVYESQLLCIADYIERKIDRDLYILHQHEEIISEIVSLSGSMFHPRIVELFMTISVKEEFWLDLISPRLYSFLLNEGPFRKTQIGMTDIFAISDLFRNIIDFRSRFTSTHSAGVAASASMLANFFGLTSTEIMLIEIAGNLHDIGKLAIPDAILNKPGSLTKKEFAVMKSHTYYTYSVIKTIGGLENVAEWAAFHHERLDGSGYPFHCTADELSTGARILMVADIFTALAEDRPYRKGMSKKEICRIIKSFSDKHLMDKRIIDLLFENCEEIFSHVTEKQAAAKKFYEKQFSSFDQ